MFTENPVNQKSKIWFTTLIDWISRPSRCALCEQSLSAEENSLFCRYCSDALPRAQQPCFQCGLELPAHQGSGIHRCGTCLTSSPIQERCLSPLLYEFPVPDLVSEIKFHQRFHVVKALCSYFSDYCAEQYQQADNLPELILPVPLHPDRAFTRGFNQAHLLSHYIGKQMHIAVSDGYLKRVKRTPSQRALDIRKRKQNVKQAFALAKPLPEGIKHIALFDDVITTGATLESVARVLKKAGVERIDFWSLARTPKFH